MSLRYISPLCLVFISMSVHYISSLWFVVMLHLHYIIPLWLVVIIMSLRCIKSLCLIDVRCDARLMHRMHATGIWALL